MKKRIFALPTGHPDLDGQVDATLAAVPCVIRSTTFDDADIILVVIGVIGFDYEALRPRLLPVADGAFEVIGVHAPGTDVPVPPVIDDLATLGLYPLDAEALAAALCDDVIAWLGGDGGAKPERQTERHCR